MVTTNLSHIVIVRSQETSRSATSEYSDNSPVLQQVIVPCVKPDQEMPPSACVDEGTGLGMQGVRSVFLFFVVVIVRVGNSEEFSIGFYAQFRYVLTQLLNFPGYSHTHHFLQRNPDNV